MACVSITRRFKLTELLGFFLFCAELPNILAVVFELGKQYYPEFFFSLVCAWFSRKKKMQIRSFFLAVSFGYLLLNEKQNEHRYPKIMAISVWFHVRVSQYLLS